MHKNSDIKSTLINYIFLLPFITAILKEVNPLFRSLYYTIDISLFLLLFLSFRRVFPKLKFRSKSEKNFVVFVILFFFYSTIGFLLNLQSPVYYIWGIRNNYRFFLYFIFCIMYLRTDAIKRNIKFIEYAYYINFVVVLVQYFFYHYRQDYLGGIFGTGTDSGAFLNLFCLIVLIVSLIRYLDRSENVGVVICKVVIGMIIAVLSETKIFFIEFAIVVLTTLVLSKKFSFKKILIGLGSIFAVVVAIRYLSIIYPQWANFFTSDAMMKYISGNQGYTGLGDINRLSFIRDCNRWLGSFFEKAIGLGIGNCDGAEGLQIVNSPFYLANKAYHYRWFTSSMTYLEQGMVGLIFYLSFYFIVIIKCLKQRTNKTISLFVINLSIICICLVFLGSTMRFEAGFIAFYFLAVPFILHNEGLNDNLLLKK